MLSQRLSFLKLRKRATTVNMVFLPRQLNSAQKKHALSVRGWVGKTETRDRNAVFWAADAARRAGGAPWGVALVDCTGEYIPLSSPLSTAFLPPKVWCSYTWVCSESVTDSRFVEHERRRRLLCTRNNTHSPPFVPFILVSVWPSARFEWRRTNERHFCSKLWAQSKQQTQLFSSCRAFSTASPSSSLQSASTYTLSLAHCMVE
jgi:hypothetical protein